MMDIIWQNTLDQGKFACRVEGDASDAYKGTLIIETEGKELHREEVGLAYGAKFGPDVEDVNYWQTVAVQVADKWYEDHGQVIPE